MLKAYTIRPKIVEGGELAVFGTLGVRDVCLLQSSQSDLAVWACSLQAIAESDHGKMRLNGFMA